MTTRDELKAKRLEAMGVVGKSRTDTAAMYDRIIEHGDKVATIRTEAEQAHIDELDAQIADLKEDAEELTEFGQAARPPTTGGTAPVVTAHAIPPSVTGSEALKALNAATPNPKGLWATDGNAYHGTNGEDVSHVETISAEEVGKIPPEILSEG